MTDATGKTAAEVHRMNRWDRKLTALLRARYLRETQPDDTGGAQRP